MKRLNYARKRKGGKEEDVELEEKKLTEDTAEVKTIKSASLRQLFRYADRYDALLLTLGILVCLVCGAGWPAMSIIFGGLSNTFIKGQNSLVNTDFGTINASLLAKFNASAIQDGYKLEQITKEMFTEQTTKYCLQYAYLGIAVLICGYIQMACWITTCERQINRIRRNFFYSILRQDISWFDKNASGTLTTKLSDSLERIKEGIGDKFGLLIQYTAQCIAGIIIAMIYSWKMTLVMMSLSPLMVGFSAFMAKLIAQSARSEQEKYSVAGGIAEEVLSCIRTVVAFNGQEQESNRYENALEKGKKDGIMKNVWTGLGMSLFFLTMFASYGLAFWYGSKLILANEIEPGDVFVVLFSVMMGSMALGSAGPQVATLAAAKGSAAAIFTIIDRVPEIDSYSIEGEKLSNIDGKIEFQDIFFNYPTRKDVAVLKGISFTVDPGQTVALVGPSGCGKSTLIQLLLRFYDPDSGKVTIDGHSLPDLNLQWLRNIIGVVSQEPILFECSIEDNIKLGRKNITNQEMVKACKMANAYDFISKLPDSFKTMVGERGIALSGGQKQRVAIARALVRDPKILLLDEATSALDAESESIVQEALEKAQQGRTTIVVAHRLSTIRNASKIIAIDNGIIKEMGTHEELINLKGLYCDLVTNQVFHDSGSGYVSGTDDDEQFESEHIESRLSGRISRQSSDSHERRQSTESETSDLSLKMRGKKKKVKRTLTHVDTEQERLKKDMKEEGAKRTNLWRILSECRQEWFYLTLSMIGAIGRGSILPAFSFFFSEIFNTYSKSGDEMMEGARFWFLMFVLLGFLNMIFLMLSVAFTGWAGENITMRLRMSVFRNVLRQDIAYFDDPKHSSGKICTRLATDAPNIRAAVDFRLSNVLSAAVSMIAGCILAFLFGWQMALLVLAVFPLIAIGSYTRNKLRAGSAKRDAQLLEEAGKVAAEGIENVRTVQSLTKEITFYENFCQHIEVPYREGIRQAHIQAINFAFGQAIFFFMYAISFRFGAFMVERDEMTPIDVFRVFFAINFSGMMVGMATAYFPEYLKARCSGGLVFKMINEQPKIDSCSQNGIKPVVTGCLSFEDVHFTYPERIEALVLQGLNFSMKTGETLALVGPSGCGKSTVVSLLERFYDPISGTIKADDFDLRKVNVPYMRQHISLVSQEPILFDCSIEENITYGLKNITHEQVIEAAKLSNIHDFIKELPKGYETTVGEKGAQLSGGQKQRVAIARALVRDPKILLLDEATSALDIESEKIVQEALDRAREGRTCIIIAHRLSTIQNADSIAVIKDGKIVEQGTHGELVAKRGAYYNLTKKQNLVV